MMDHPGRFFLALGAALAGAVSRGADLATVSVPQAENAAPSQHERAISPRAAALLAAGLPRPEAAKPAATDPAPSPGAAGESEKPQNVIVHLPRYLVREPRVPAPEDVRTPRGLEVYAMNKYLGAPDGFSRAVLNRFTIADAWKHVPILGRFPWFSSPEKTAVDMYYDDEHRKKMAELWGLQAIQPKAGAGTTADKAAPAPAENSAPPITDGK